MTAAVAWSLLAFTVALEVAGTSMLKLAEGFQKPLWFFAAIASYCVCFALLATILKVLPLSVTYAVWAGAGAAAVTAIDVFIFGQPLSLFKIACIGLIIAGVVGLKLSG